MKHYRAVEQGSLKKQVYLLNLDYEAFSLKAK